MRPALAKFASKQASQLLLLYIIGSCYVILQHMISLILFSILGTDFYKIIMQICLRNHILIYISLSCNFERKVLFELFVWNEHAHTMHLHDETIFCRVDYLLIGSSRV